MSYEIKQGDLFGRIGTGVGKGLAETVPKEVERYRLSSGLNQFEKDVEGLSPMQQITRLAAIPGALEHPQLVQSIGELAKQQSKAKALTNRLTGQSESQKSPFPEREKVSAKPSETPSITTSQPIKETLENYIPKTYEQLLDDAGAMYEKNPALYENNPQKAMEAAQFAEKQRADINAAYQQRRTNQEKIQDNVVDRLRNQAKNLGVSLPPNVYSEIEDKAINAVKPISQGGDGKTDQQAIKDYGKELDTISRDYQSVEDLGNWSMIGSDPKETVRSIESLQKKFAERNDLENFADELIGTNGFSPGKAYSKAYPVEKQPELNKELNKVKPLEKIFNYKKGYPALEVPEEIKVAETLKLSKKIAPLLKDGSPLAVAEKLKKLNYDPSTWLKYVDDNRKQLDISERQGRELDKQQRWTSTLNDLWIFGF